jgi:hypothetical protein
MKKLWIAFAVVMALSFAILGWIGTRIYQERPPLPVHVVTTEGESLFADGAVERGQNVWQSMGGMEVGSIWGHGSYVAPDWTADWLHREVTFVLGEWSRNEYGKDFGSLGAEDKARLRELPLMRYAPLLQIPLSTSGLIFARKLLSARGWKIVWPTRDFWNSLRRAAFLRARPEKPRSVSDFVISGSVAPEVRSSGRHIIAVGDAGICCL